MPFEIPLDGANAHAVNDNYQYFHHAEFKPVKLPVTTLDLFMDSQSKDKPVSLIKIDVEAFEPNVLVGAENLIATESPMLWIEFNSVALNVAHRYSSMAFALGLFQRFEVMEFVVGGELEIISDPG